MMLLFTVDGVSHELLVPDLDDLPVLGAEICSYVMNECGEKRIQSDLESRIHDQLLDALVDETDLDLGEVITKTN